MKLCTRTEIESKDTRSFFLVAYLMLLVAEINPYQMGDNTLYFCEGPSSKKYVLLLVVFTSDHGSKPH
jgi:hypothetical protein